MTLKRKFDKVLTQKIVVSAVPKNDLMIIRPYLGQPSLQSRNRINRVMENKLAHRNLQIVFWSNCKFINFFTFKDKIPILLRSGIVYKFKCGGCNAIYYGKTKPILKSEIVNTLKFLLLLERK